MMIDEKENNVKNKSTRMIDKGILLYTAHIGSTEGIKALFVGLEPRVARALVSGAIQFFTYELTQNALR